VGMTACSDEDMPGGNEGTPVSQSTVTVGNDPTAQADRITFFGNPGSLSTRDGDGVDLGFDIVGSAPTSLPSEKVLNCNAYNSTGPDTDAGKTDYWHQRQNNAYDSFILNVNPNNNNIEICGGKTVYIPNKTDYTIGSISRIGDTSKDATLIVMEGAKLTIGSQVGDGVVIKSYGDLDISVYCTINGKILAKDLVEAKNSLVIDGGQVVVNGRLNVAEQLKLTSNGKAKAICIEVGSTNNDAAVYVDAGSILGIRNYLICDNMKIKGDVYLWPYAMADIGWNADKENTDESTSLTFLGGKFHYYTSQNHYAPNYTALVRTNKYELKSGNGYSIEGFEKMFSENLKIRYNKIDTDLDKTKILPSEDDYPIPSNVKHGGCNPGNGDQSKIVVSADPKAFITAPSSGHGHTYLSATCVQPSTYGAYVSYHLNAEYTDDDVQNVVGTGDDKNVYGGCVELINVTMDKASIDSWLMNEDFDFNHCLFDNNYLYTVGDTKKYGATLGRVKLDAGKFGQTNLGTDNQIMQYFKLYKDSENKGSSGNCIIKDGQNFRIASQLGFQSYSVSDLEKEEPVLTKTAEDITTSGSAKHVAQKGNLIVTLNLDNRGSKDNPITSSTATVTVYNGGWNANGQSFQTDKIITPIDGKNVIATDGTHIYVALGENGVDKYTLSGQCVGHYSWIEETNKQNSDKKALANGLDVDDNYIYVANGNAGLIILDKNQTEDGKLNRVYRYYRGNYKEGRSFSANYVKVVNGMIYIAYGRNGLEVVKINPVQVDTNAAIED